MQNLYEAMLEARVRLQQPLLAGGRLPLTDVRSALSREEPTLTEEFQEARAEIAALLADALRLRHSLYALNPSVVGVADAATPAGKQQLQATLAASLPAGLPALVPATPPPSKRRRVAAGEEEEEEEEGDDADVPVPVSLRDAAGVESGAYWRAIEAGWDAFAPYRDETVDTWGRTLTYAGGLTQKQAVKLRVMNADISKQVSNIMADRERLLARTRPKAEAVAVLGQARSEQAGDHVFDDSDFYQVLLREFVSISASSAATQAAGGIRSYASKKREGVDHRASKGRKLKYVTHPKLVNFVAPRPYVVPPDMSYDLDTVVASLFKSA
ncbi:hypothetical protein EON66_08225 [archaeon]|nr:MAG: hypothetical protein EON66_08225 [archaeon]